MKLTCAILASLTMLAGCSTPSPIATQRVDRYIQHATSSPIATLQVDRDIQHAKTTSCQAAYLMSLEIDAALRAVPLLADYLNDTAYLLTPDGWGATFESGGSGKPGARCRISRRMRIGGKPSIPAVTTADIKRLQGLLERATEPRRLFNTMHTQQRNGRAVQVTGNLMRKDTPRWYVWRNVGVTNHVSGGISVTIEMDMDYE